MDRFMRLAWKEAEASAKEGGVRCGAVMVLDGEVVIRTRDRTVQTNHHQPLAHAAMEAFRHASLRNDWNKATLVTTHSLCWMCVGMVLQFNVGHVVCGAAPADKKQKEAIAYLRERGVTVDLLSLPEFVTTPGGCPPPEEMTNHTECTPLCSEDKALETAYLQAEKSYNEGGVPVGASVTVDGQVIARGHNRRVQDGNPTSHGETQCFTNSGGSVEWNKSTLYTTLSPCMLCTGSVLHLGIPKVVIGENKTFGGNEELLRKHGVEVVILEDQKCYDMMQRFVQERPDIWNGDIGENNE